MGKICAGRMAVVLGLLAVMLLVGGRALAQEGAVGAMREGVREGVKEGVKEGMKQGMQEEKQCPMCQMREGQMKTMGEVQQLLADAKIDADKGEAAMASAKIAKAQELLQAHHKKMMSMEAESKGKCPMCGKMMGKGQQVPEEKKEATKEY